MPVAEGVSGSTSLCWWFPFDFNLCHLQICLCLTGCLLVFLSLRVLVLSGPLYQCLQKDTMRIWKNFPLGCGHLLKPVVCVPGSLCTMLSLQWEPEIIAVAVMYLAGRLCKFDIQEWTTKQSSRRWWEQFVQDVPVELLEGRFSSTSYTCCFPPW